MDESFYNVVIWEKTGDGQNWLKTMSNGNVSLLTLQFQYIIIHTCVAVNSPNK